MNYKNIGPFGIIAVALIILNLVNGRFSDPMSWLISELYVLPGIVIGLTFHEFAHGIVSYKLGDPTPKLQRRLSLNPMAHIDPIGFICLLLAGFGWGIPVQIDPRYYKHPRRDEFFVAIAGVTMNFIIAIVFSLVFSLVYKSNIYNTAAWVEPVLQILAGVVMINIVLMIFNLLPIPPLDGFSIITEIFNLKKYSWYHSFYEHGGLILMLVIIFDLTDIILTPAVRTIYQFVSGLWM